MSAGRSDREWRREGGHWILRGAEGRELAAAWRPENSERWCWAAGVARGAAWRLEEALTAAAHASRTCPQQSALDSGWWPAL